MNKPVINLDKIELFMKLNKTFMVVIDENEKMEAFERGRKQKGTLIIQGVECFIPFNVKDGVIGPSELIEKWTWPRR